MLNCRIYNIRLRGFDYGYAIRFQVYLIEPATSWVQLQDFRLKRSAIVNSDDMYNFFQPHKHVYDFVGRQERYARYRGTARIDISHLRVDPSPQSLTLEHIETLKAAFSHQGCHRLEPANRIVALVSQQELATLLRHSDLSQSTLLHGADMGDKPPTIICPLNTTIRVFHGQHRLEAAISYFPSDDAWWTVDLFLDGKKALL